MAGIKDKLVSVESLSEVHQHNKDTYMTKVNPIVSGTITFDGDVTTSNGFNISAKNDSFEISSENKEAKLIIGDNNVFMYADGEKIEQDENGTSVTKNIDSSISVIPNHIYLGSINDTDSTHSKIKIENSKINIDSDNIELDGDVYAYGSFIPENINVPNASIDDDNPRERLLTETYNSMPNDSVKTIALRQNGWSGDVGFNTIYKIDEKHGIATQIDYTTVDESGIRAYFQTYYDGVWQGWKSFGLCLTEVGEWTATTNKGTITSQHCTYQRVGNMCTISFFINGVGASDDDNVHLYITGVPYNPQSGSKWYGGGGHVQGLWDVSNSNRPFTGFVIHPNGQIYGRTKESDNINGSYVYANNGGEEFYLSGTIMYPIEE